MLSLTSKVDRSFEFAGKQLRHLIETYPDYFPIFTVNGRWKHGDEARSKWCQGFLGGQLWLMHHHTGESYWREKAEHYSRLIGHFKDDPSVDLGSLFWSTWKRWYDLTGDPAINEVVICAGRTLSPRFKEKGQYLRSFVGDESLIIDTMMNVAIIFYAALQTNDADLRLKAIQHCLTTRKYLVRGDGSTSHEGIFNTETGEFLHQSTHQGWRHDSSWARGLTWAMYGFGTTYSFTRDVRFLQTTEACANFYIERTSASGVPPNDWDEPNPTLPFESSAAAIAASGLLTLAKLTGDPARARFYRDYALRILDTLTEPEFLAVETPGWEGILKHGIYHDRKGVVMGESLIWGDHYFLEALSKVVDATIEPCCEPGQSNAATDSLNLPIRR